MTIHTKLIEFHKAFSGAKKTGVNPHFGNQHFTLDDVVHATTPILNDLGLYVFHHVEDGNLVTTVADEEGDKIESRIPMALNGNPQAAGSMVTYYKRYNLCALLNIAEQDDDGNAATAAVKPISDEEAATIREFVEELGIDLPAYLKLLGATEIEGIQASQFQRAMNLIERKRKAVENAS